VNDAFFVSIEPYAAPPPQILIKDCHNIMAAFHALEDICGAQKCAFLPLSLSFEPDYPGMDQLAYRVRNYLGVGEAVVFDYFELFENHGLRIILFPFQRTSSSLDSISFYEPAFHNAFFFLNSRKNPEKQLFSLSKELGKILVLNEMRSSRISLFFETTGNAPGDRPINIERAVKRFAATFLMPEKAVKATVVQLGISPDNWSWDLVLRIKHRFGVSTEAFLYRLKELNLISAHLAKQYKNKIDAFYDQTDYAEPDASRRCLTPNGRFYDLLLTAGSVQSAEKEVETIKTMTQKFRLVKI
jgi:Zn-dependent peptidase ImmA (M78 family)